MKKLLESTRLTPEMLESSKAPAGTDAIVRPAEQSSAALSLSSAGQTLAQLLKRPELSIEQLAAILKKLKPGFFERENNPQSSEDSLPSQIRNELKSVETEIKYEGYLLQQQRAIERLKKSEQHSIPEWFDYHSVSGLSREMQEKLTKIRPRTIGQASRIPGVTPAAVSLVNVFIEIQARRRNQSVSLQ
jgi:tRNA uridine 5-carboxymethylaminomethyl modification enzyme